MRGALVRAHRRSRAFKTLLAIKTTLRQNFVNPSLIWRGLLNNYQCGKQTKFLLPEKRGFPVIFHHLVPISSHAMITNEHKNRLIKPRFIKMRDDLATYYGSSSVGVTKMCRCEKNAVSSNSNSHFFLCEPSYVWNMDAERSGAE